MKPAFNFPSTLLLFGFLLSSAPAQDRLTVEDIYGTALFDSRTLSGMEWIPGQDAFTYTETDDDAGSIRLIRFDCETGDRTVLIDSGTIPQLGTRTREKRFRLPNYLWSPTGRQILLPFENDLYLFRIDSQDVIRLTYDEEIERDPTFSPDGAGIAYLKGWNLRVLDIETREETVLTHQGTDDLLIGRFDYVYEEEFGERTGFFWSSDSRHLAYFEVDQSGIPEFPLVGFIPVHNEVEMLHYAKAGDPNSILRIGVVPSGGGETTWMDIGEETDIYIPRIHWTGDGTHLAIQRLNRLQNHLDLLIADSRTGRSEVVLSEDDPEGWVEYNEDLHFLQGGRRFLWLSERSGWNHLYLHRIDGTLLRPLTAGAWEVTEIVGIDGEGESVFFEGTKESRYERHLYSVGFDGKNRRTLTREPGTHDIDMAPGGTHYLDVYSSKSRPPRTTLHSARGRRLHLVESGEIEALKNRRLAPMEFFTITTGDGLELDAYMIRPLDFDPGKKYPVIVYTYGMPGSQTVRDSWPRARGIWYQLLLEEGFLVFAVENRGASGRGNDFKNLAYGNIGIGVLDEISGAKHLRTLPYVDPDRIGIWGWSGGGYMTCLAMTFAAEYFRVGVAVAPVTDYRNYDTIWTELRMGLPAENAEGYDFTNPISHIDKYRGGLFLVHGTADDNVHMSSTLQLAYALQNARKPFRMMIYPEKEHSIRGEDTQAHLFRMITDYFLETLK